MQYLLCLLACPGCQAASVFALISSLLSLHRREASVITYSKITWLPTVIEPHGLIFGLALLTLTSGSSHAAPLTDVCRARSLSFWLQSIARQAWLAGRLGTEHRVDLARGFWKTCRVMWQPGEPLSRGTIASLALWSLSICESMLARTLFHIQNRGSLAWV